ncbi:Uncharacterized protein APZ42_033757 [Daphnia magna]|uniref:Uncharacterized protein n=1 Tax=Daphnia magna TaxID=35525 RepID=A0A164KVC0_9CRUS|nr:Uncharacterized protein APZ42_033757 [Daphnia magna]
MAKAATVTRPRETEDTQSLLDTLSFTKSKTLVNVGFRINRSLTPRRLVSDTVAR